DPETGLPVERKSGRFGPYVQVGEGKEARRASIPKDIEDFDLEWALKLLGLPRIIGPHPETGHPIEAAIGRYGPYLRHDGKYAKLSGTRDVFDVGMNRAVDLLAQAANRGGAARGSREPLKVYGQNGDGADVKLMEGRYGAYITDGTTNVTIPKDKDKDALTLDEALAMLAE
ncbi:MAG: DNA topoisomerase I, partial [Erythrobacter sp.]|nr:DNA topoisomerase I [Erythrobacter sp.]